METNQGFIPGWRVDKVEPVGSGKIRVIGFNRFLRESFRWVLDHYSFVNFGHKSEYDFSGAVWFGNSMEAFQALKEKAKLHKKL